MVIVNGFRVELKTGEKVYYITDVSVKITQSPLCLAPLYQGPASCEILGDFSKLGLNPFDRYECKFYKLDAVLNGDFYYNDITHTIELTGALVYG